MTSKPRLPHDYLRLALDSLKTHSWAFGTSGVLLMIVHFIRIEYMPALTLAELGLVGGAALLFTMVAAIAYIAVLILPGACYDSWSRGRIIPRPLLPGRNDRYSRFKLLPENQRLDTNCQLTSSQVSLKNARSGTNLAIAGIAFAGFMMAMASYAVALYVYEPLSSELALGTFLIGVLSTIVFASLPTTRIGRALKRSTISWKWFLFASTWSLYCATVPLGLIIFGSVTNNENTNEVTLLLSLLWLPLAHLCVYLTSRMEIAARVNAIFIVSIYMIVTMGTTTSALDRAASKLRLGLMRNQTVILTPRGCDSLFAARIIKECLVFGEGGALRRAEPVTILTRIGSHVVITSASWSNKEKTRSVPVKQEDVITWFAAPAMDSRIRTPSSNDVIRKTKH